MSRTASPDWFVVYEGEDPVVVGTDHECARKLGVTVRQIRTMATPSFHATVAKTPNSASRIAERVKLETVVVAG